MPDFNLKQFLRDSEEEWQAAAEEAKNSPGFERLPDNRYIARLTAAEVGLSQNDSPQVVWDWTVLDGEFRGEMTRDYDGLEREDAFLWLCRKLNKLGYDPTGFKLRNLERVLGELVARGITARIILKTKASRTTGDEFQRMIINKMFDDNYDPTAAEDDDDDTPVPAKKAPAAAVSKKRAPVDDDDEDEPAPPKKKATKPAPVEDDDDEDEAPPPPKKKAKPAPVEDDEDDEPAPVVKKKRPAAPEPEDDDDDAPVPAKKTVAKKPAVTEDDDDDEDEAPVKRGPGRPPKAATPADTAAAPKRGVGRPPKTATAAPAPAAAPKKKAAPPPVEEEADELKVGLKVEFTRKGKPMIGEITELPDDMDAEDAEATVQVGNKEYDVLISELVSVDEETDD